ncbi:hypothetical protein BMS3Abin13_01965 [bacterium BMS3Abin13]|nr:hypothetical protein BMS3Abin13_01965 [bacterium BMS3Abin13]
MTDLLKLQPHELFLRRHAVERIAAGQEPFPLQPHHPVDRAPHLFIHLAEPCHAEPVGLGPEGGIEQLGLHELQNEFKLTAQPPAVQGKACRPGPEGYLDVMAGQRFVQLVPGQAAETALPDHGLGQDTQPRTRFAEPAVTEMHGDQHLVGFKRRFFDVKNGAVGKNHPEGADPGQFFSLDNPRRRGGHGQIRKSDLRLTGPGFQGCCGRVLEKTPDHLFRRLGRILYFNRTRHLEQPVIMVPGGPKGAVHLGRRHFFQERPIDCQLLFRRQDDLVAVQLADNLRGELPAVSAGLGLHLFFQGRPQLFFRPGQFLVGKAQLQGLTQGVIQELKALPPTARPGFGRQGCIAYALQKNAGIKPGPG